MCRRAYAKHDFGTCNRQHRHTCDPAGQRRRGWMGTGKGIYLICCENAFGRGYCTADPSLRFGKGFRRLEGDLAYQSDMRSKLCAHRETDTHTHTISKDIQRLVLGAELPEPWLDKSAPEESPARVLSSIHSLTQSLCWHTGGLYHKPHSPSRRQRAPSLFICARLSPGMQYSARSTCARKRGRKRSDTGYRRLQRAQVKSQCQCRQLLWWCRPPPPCNRAARIANPATAIPGRSASPVQGTAKVRGLAAYSLC